MALTYNTHSDGGFDVLVSTVVSQQFHQHVCAETLTRLSQVLARMSDAHFTLTLCVHNAMLQCMLSQSFSATEQWPTHIVEYM